MRTYEFLGGVGVIGNAKQLWTVHIKYLFLYTKFWKEGWGRVESPKKFKTSFMKKLQNKFSEKIRYVCK